MTRAAELAAEQLEKVETAMREARDLIRAADGDSDAQQLAAMEPTFTAVHALWGWAVATTARLDFLEDDLLKLADTLERIGVIPPE